MSYEDFKKLTSELAQNLDNQAKATEILDKVNNYYSDLYNTSETIKKEHEKSKEEIDSLRDTNMNLFLKVSEQSKDSKQDDPHQEETKEPLKYDDLVKQLEE